MLLGGGVAVTSVLGDEAFHLEPQYREATPLDALILKRDAGLDDFLAEKLHDRIAAVLANWSQGLRESSPTLVAIERALAVDFLGAPMEPVETKPLRNGPELKVSRLTFATATTLGPRMFLEELRRYVARFTGIRTADFQVIRIEPGERIETDVRFQLTGAGKGYYREQRTGIWLMQWEADSSGGYRVRRWSSREETRSRCQEPLFQDLTTHALGGNGSYAAQLAHGVDYWRTVLDGACGIDIYGHNGVAVGDAHGKGLDDLYICQPSGLPNRLYRNRGDGTFEDVTEKSGVGLLENSSCAIFADFENAGRQDLLVVRASGPLLFRNEGNSKFRAVPDAFRFAHSPQGTFTGAAAADYNRDGLLDIYFCLYVYYQGANQYKYPTPYFDANNGPPNFLMCNNGDGTFRDATAESGLNKNNTRYSFCCGWTDYNRDGWPDLYVVNDFGRKNLYRNNGDGTFTDIADEAGVADVGAGMSICCFDYDNDGAEDLYVADMWTAAGARITADKEFQESSPPSVRNLYRKHAMGNSLFRNTGDGRFQDVTAISGTGMGRWSWSSDAWDFDHDGFPDLYITNGMISGPVREDLNSFFWRQVVAKSPSQAKASNDYEQGWNAINEMVRADFTWSGYERNVFYANNRDGTFSDVSGAVGLDFLEDGRAFALADFDRDGRLEVFLKNRNGPQVRLLKNVTKDLPPSVCFHLRGTKSNRDAIGAAITLETGTTRQVKTVQAGSGFLSQHTKAVFFGLGDAKGPLRASIHWPSGLLQQVSGLELNCRFFIEEGKEAFHSEPFEPLTTIRSADQLSDELPDNPETWLLSPVTAPEFPALTALRGKPVILRLANNTIRLSGLPSLTLDCSDTRNDTVAIYNLLYRSLFDRHRDLSLPTSFLIDSEGEIVKIYRGPIDVDHARGDLQNIPMTAAARLSRALPLATESSTFAFGRNNLSLGSVYFQRGYYDQAEISFRIAARDDPFSAEAQYGLGSVSLKQGDTAKAQISFERAVNLNASYPDTLSNGWNNLGLLAAQSGKLERAIECFEQALKANPEHIVSLQNLGNALRQGKRYEEAQATLQQALTLSPENPELHYGLAMVFAQTDRPAEAYEHLRLALRQRPKYPEAMNNLGVLYLRTKRRDEAVAQFELAIRTAPEFDQPYLNLARVYMIEGNVERARSTLQGLLKKHPNHPAAIKLLEEAK